MNEYYSDGKTKIIDPFWEVKCLICGHATWTVVHKSKCSKCGGEATCVAAGKEEKNLIKKCL